MIGISGKASRCGTYNPGTMNDNRLHDTGIAIALCSFLLALNATASCLWIFLNLAGSLYCLSSSRFYINFS